MNVHEVVKIFEESGLVISNSYLSGDYKTGNREWKKLVKIYKKIENDHDFVKNCIELMYNSKIDFVVLKGAVFSLALGFEKNKAIETMENISKNSTNPSIRFDAKMTLEVWKENGELSVYPKK